MTLLLILIIIAFLSGLYFIIKYSNPKSLEGLVNNVVQPRCPNMLIQKGSRFYLYNSKVAQVPGVNPIEFENLEDYVEFIDWQRSQGIRCPVLYLQHTYDVQGSSVYKVRPSVTEPQGGLPPASTTQTSSQISGSESTAASTVDTSSESTANMLFSPDPMDPNWGGQRYTQQLVDSGFYEGNEVSIALP